jgi:NTE family protein
VPAKQRKSLIQKLQKDIDNAPNYDAWQNAALSLDHIEGNDEWKRIDKSSLYDYTLISRRLEQLRLSHRTNDIAQLIRALREGLHHDLGNMGNYKLYNKSHIGTKKLIEDYVSQVCYSLDYLCDNDVPELPLDKKLGFFEDTSLSFGRPSLLLSGGATLGLFHLGVVKALWEHDLLPQVIAGSSIGSIIAGIIGTRTDDELGALLDRDDHDLQAWKYLGLKGLLLGRGLFDAKNLEQCIRLNIGEQTFQEAYEHSGRSTNISVSPAAIRNQKSRLLCGYTSPYVTIWSAALASCSIPGIFPPATLIQKNANNSLSPYLPLHRWVDGSVKSDLPIERLTHLYDVNYHVVSQTNPHIVPFIPEGGHAPDPSWTNLPWRMLKSELQYHGTGVFDFLRKKAPTEILRQTAGHAYTVMAQRYYGDVTIAPRYTVSDFMKITKNPTPEMLQQFMLEGQRATWPQISMIKAHSQISQTLEQCIKRTKRRLKLKIFC